jgi:nucleotide-binding universal stress UspA family protein
MNSIKRILYPTDFSAMSMMGYKYCLNLARQLGARVDVLHVYRVDLGVPVPDAMSYTLVEERKNNAHLKLGVFAHLTQSEDKSLLEGLDIHAHAAVGLPEDEIARFAKDNDNDLILMPTKGEHNLIEVLFGSVTTAIVAKAECPVLVIPEGSEYIKIKNIAYATDLTDANINHKDAPLALAKLFHSNLHYVHINNGVKAPEWDIQRLLDSKNEGGELSFHELEANSVQEGMKHFLKFKKIDMMITYSPPKSFFERLFKWSTTRNIAEHVIVPLFVVK